MSDDLQLVGVALMQQVLRVHMPMLLAPIH